MLGRVQVTKLLILPTAIVRLLKDAGSSYTACYRRLPISVDGSRSQSQRRHRQSSTVSAGDGRTDGPGEYCMPPPLHVRCLIAQMRLRKVKTKAHGSTKKAKTFLTRPDYCHSHRAVLYCCHLRRKRSRGCLADLWTDSSSSSLHLPQRLSRPRHPSCITNHRVWILELPPTLRPI